MLDRFLKINLDSDKKPILSEEELKKCRNYKLFEGGELEYGEKTWNHQKPRSWRRQRLLMII